MQLPDKVVSDKGGVLALVVEIQAWFTLCLEELLSLLRKTQRFRVYTSVGAFNPCLLVTKAECSIWYHTGWNLCSRWRAVSPSDTDQGSVRASEAVESSDLR